jgi:hypothetical protein
MIIAAVIVAVVSLGVSIPFLLKGSEVKKIPIQLTFDSQRGSTYTGEEYAPITILTTEEHIDNLPAPLKPGAIFSGWSVDGVNVITTTTKLTQDTHLYGKWNNTDRAVALFIDNYYIGDVTVPMMDTGITNTELNDGSWILPTDTHNGNAALWDAYKIIKENAFYDFHGWEYINERGETVQLLLTRGSGTAPNSWAVKTGDSEPVPVTDEDKFYPPIHTTMLRAIVDFRPFFVEWYDAANGKGLLHRNDTLNFFNNAKITMPEFNGQALNFSHWEFSPGDFGSLIPAKGQDEFDKLKNTHYLPGDEIFASFIMYYLTNDFTVYTTEALKQYKVAIIKFNAVLWSTNSTHYIMRKHSAAGDTVAGVEQKGISFDFDYGEHPVYMVSGNASAAMLVKDESIDYYEITYYATATQQYETETVNVSSIADSEIDNGVSLAEFSFAAVDTTRTIYFDVYYFTATKDVTVTFNYGSNILSLAEQNYATEAEPVTSITKKVGEYFTFPTAEMFMKMGYNFYGWRFDDPNDDRVFYAGQKYIIPAMEDNELHFIAYWSDPLFPFIFDLDGGRWTELIETETMRGFAGEVVQIIDNIPTKYGYYFSHWAVGGNHYNSGDTIAVTSEKQTLTAVWVPKPLQVNFVYKSYNDVNELIKHAVKTVDGHVGDVIPTPSGNEIEMIYRANGFDFGGAWDKNGVPVTAPAAIKFDIELILALGGGYYTTMILFEEEERVEVTVDEDLMTVDVYAYQTARFVNIVYHDFDGNPILNNSGFEYVVEQNKLFSSYTPFSISAANNVSMTVPGYNFLGWTTNAGDGNGWKVDTAEGSYIPALVGGLDSHIPSNTAILHVYAVYRIKIYEINYVYPNGTTGANIPIYATLFADDNNGAYYNFNTIFSLLNPIGNTAYMPKLTTGSVEPFYGWSYEKDESIGDPDIVYVPKTGAFVLLSQTNSTTSGLNMINAEDSNIAASYFSTHYVITLYPVYSSAEITLSFSTIVRTDTNGDGDYTDEEDIPDGGEYKQIFIGKGVTESSTGYVFKSALYGDTERTPTIGGKTVGTSSADYRTYGIMLPDGVGFYREGYNFIGWEAVNKYGVGVAKFNSIFTPHKIWYPGEYLPSFDFSVDFRVVWAKWSKATNTTGVPYEWVVDYSDWIILSDGTNIANTSSTFVDGKLRVISVPGPDSDVGAYNYLEGARFKHTALTNLTADVVTLPYEFGDLDTAGMIKISGATRVILPVKYGYYLSAVKGAIIADGLTEIYINDWLVSNQNYGNLPNIIGMSSEARNFTTGGLQRFVVAKGLDVWLTASDLGRPEDGTVEFTTYGRTARYSYAFNSAGMLFGYVIKDNKTTSDLELLAVPSSVSMSQNTFDAKTVTNLKKIKSYAFTGVGTLEKILLNVDHLVIEKYAINFTKMNTLALPDELTIDEASAEMIYGYNQNLATVYFKNASDFSSNYAFVENKMLYFSRANTKERLLFMLRGYIGEARVNGLCIALNTAVTVINDYALSNIDYTQTRSVAAEGAAQEIVTMPAPVHGTVTYGFSKIMFGDGMPDTFPIFVHKDKMTYYAKSNVNNDITNPHTQTYVKKLYFKYDDTPQSEAVYSGHDIVYGENIEFFNPEYNTGSFNIHFEKLWYAFISWNVQSYGTDSAKYVYTYQPGDTVRVGASITNGNPKEIYIADSITLFASWLESPIRFIDFDGGEINSFKLRDINSAANQYSIDELSQYDDQSALNVQLLGLTPDADGASFTSDGVTYNFVGWTTSNQTNRIWDDTPLADRILPDGSESSRASILRKSQLYTNGNGGTMQPVSYYALYARQTDNLFFSLTGSKYGVSYDTVNENLEEKNIYIPYAAALEPNSRGDIYMGLVSSVAAHTFAGLSHITGDIFIGGAVTEIGVSAFQATNAQRVTFGYQVGDTKLGSSTLFIRDFAFADNKKLVYDLVLPRITDVIGVGAFRNNTQLHIVEIQDGSISIMLTKVDNFAFAHNESMYSNAIVGSDSKVLSQITTFGIGVFMGTALTQDIIYYNNTTHKNVLIHAGKIGTLQGSEMTFNGALDGVPSKYDVIGEYALSYNKILKKITITSAISEVKAFAFYQFGNQLEIIDLTDSNPAPFNTEAFNGVNVCKLYIEFSYKDSWKAKFPSIKHWFEDNRNKDAA